MLCTHTDILFYLITTIHPAFDFNGNLLPLIIFNQANKFNFAQANIHIIHMYLFVSVGSVTPYHFHHKNRNVIYTTETKQQQKNTSHCLALTITT